MKTIKFRQSFGLTAADFVSSSYFVRNALWQSLSQALFTSCFPYICSLFEVSKNVTIKQSYGWNTHPEKKILPNHKYKSKYIWLNYYFSNAKVIGLQRTPLLIWWWGGLTVWATLSPELLTVCWGPPGSLLKMEHVVKENTTGSLRFELEMG